MDYIAYIRVSTKKQSHGLNAQKQIIKNHIAAKGAKLIKVFSDKSSGKNAERSVLKSAIAEAKKQNATLIIAKLDRISRDIRFIFDLKENLETHKIPLECVEIPMLNTLTIGIFAVMAQHEREIISQRTKDGLAAARASGKRLGRPPQTARPLLPKAEPGLATAANSTAAVEHHAKILPIVASLRKSGQNLAQIADCINNAGHRTRRGLPYTPTAISRLLTA